MRLCLGPPLPGHLWNRMEQPQSFGIPTPTAHEVLSFAGMELQVVGPRT